MARHPLDLASAALLDRIEREDARAPTTAHSHLIGGVAVVGSRVDDLLRALLVEVAAVAGRSPEEFLPRVGQRTVSLRRATAGQLLQATKLASDGVALSPEVRLCVDDIRGPASALGAFIHLRNLAVHQTVLPKDARATLKRLGTLLREHRRGAGW